MDHTLALIHTSPVLVPLFDGLCRQHLPGIRVFHMVDESLIKNTIAAGALRKTTVRRLAAQVGSAFDAGATAVFVTCSSIGPGVAVARQLYDGPIFRVDEAMAAKAVATGPRIGVLATLNTTLDPTVQLLRDTASALGRKCEVTSSCCDGAFEAMLAGNTGKHDRMVSAELIRLASSVDVFVLAQASMARVLASLPAGQPPVPVLTSPELAVLQIRDSLTGAPAA